MLVRCAAAKAADAGELMVLNYLDIHFDAEIASLFPNISTFY